MRTTHIIALGLLSSLMALAIDAVVPALEAISLSLGVEAANTSLTISVFLLGVALGEFCAGPLSDAYGRRRILLAALAIFTVASGICLLLADMLALTGFRFVQAIGAGAASTLAVLLISDRFNLTDTARFISLTFFIAMALRIAAPIAGFQITNTFGWQSLFLCFALMGTVLAVYFFYPAAYTKKKSATRPFTLARLGSDCRKILRDRRAQLYIGAEIATSLGLFAYVATASTIMVRQLNIPDTHFSMLVAGGTALMMIGAYLNSLLVAKVGVDRMMLIASSLLLLIAVMLLAVLSADLQNTALTAGLILSFLLPAIIVRINANTGCIKRFPGAAGTASSLLNSLGLIAGAAAGVLCGIVFNGALVALACLLLVSALVSLACSQLLNMPGATADVCP